MIGSPPVEQDISKRCSSSDVESPGRTHWCRLTAHSFGEHLCICQRSWGEAVPA